MLERSRLLRPLNYLWITSDGKELTLFNWIYPFTLTAAISSYILLCPVALPLFACGNSSTVIGHILPTLQILPGFYIAALAAIATFPRNLMDQEIAGVKLYLDAVENGMAAKRSLTRRHFLCYLFGYLCFLSLWLVCFGCLLEVAPPTAFLAPDKRIYGEWFFFVLFLFSFVQMLVLTLLALFYLSDRMHWKSLEKRID
jgi:hypothetical protein